MATSNMVRRVSFLFLICDPFWENLPIRTDNFFPDLLIKA